MLVISVDYRLQSVSICSADLCRRCCWPFKRYQARVEPEAARRRWQRHGPTAALAFLGLLLWLLGVVPRNVRARGAPAHRRFRRVARRGAHAGVATPLAARGPAGGRRQARRVFSLPGWPAGGLAARAPRGTGRLPDRTEKPARLAACQYNAATGACPYVTPWPRGSPTTILGNRRRTATRRAGSYCMYPTRRHRPTATRPRAALPRETRVAARARPARSHPARRARQRSLTANAWGHAACGGATRACCHRCRSSAREARRQILETKVLDGEGRRREASTSPALLGLGPGGAPIGGVWVLE